MREVVWVRVDCVESATNTNFFGPIYLTCNLKYLCENIVDFGQNFCSGSDWRNFRPYWLMTVFSGDWVVTSSVPRLSPIEQCVFF